MRHNKLPNPTDLGALNAMLFPSGVWLAKSKGWLEGQLIWCIELCAKMIAIDQSLSSPVWRTVQKDGSIQHSSIPAFHFKKVNNISMRETISYTGRWRKLLCPKSFWNFGGLYHQIWISVQAWNKIFFANNFPAHSYQLSITGFTGNTDRCRLEPQ